MKTRAPRRTRVPAPLLVVVIALSMQSGSALAVKLIGMTSVVTALWLRTAVAALMLAALRPRSLRLPRRGDRVPLLMLTLSLLGMNLSFYGAISHAPVGVVVAVEFLGPLSVSVLGSRRPLDFLWVLLAASGVGLLGTPTSSVSTLGLGLALVAAAFWAAFILLAKRAVTTMDPLPVTTLMLVGSTALLTPLLLGTGASEVLDARALALGCTVAVLSSALPYFLELYALRLVRAATYGVLLSIEPAVAALTGFVILGQTLAPAEIAAIAAVIVAAAGASWWSEGSRR